MDTNNNFNELDKETITHEHTLKYGDLWRHAVDTLSLSYCISEFIDNSISSCELTYWNKGIEHELIIDINYHQEGDMEWYEIIDNAGGMDKQELNDAMIFGNKRYKNDNSYKNQYGIGMKTAIFWIGEDAEIFTKKNGIEWRGEYLANGKDDMDSVVHRISMSNNQQLKNYESGTKIIIYGSNGKDRTMTKNQAEEYVSYFLGNRYSRYLNDNRSNNIFKCTINISYKIGRQKTNSLKVKKITVENDKTKVFRYIEKNGNSKSKEDVKILIQNKISSDPKLSSIKGTLQYETFMNKLLNSKELSFDDTLEIYVNKNTKYSAPVKVYLLEHGDKYSCGVGIIHSNRYIFHPVKLDKERKEHLAGLYEPFDMKQYEDRGKWIRVDLDISKIESNELCQKIYPEKNKTKLIFDDDSDIVEDSGMSGYSFKGGLRAIFYKWIPYVTLLREISNLETSKIKAIDLQNKEIGVIARDENVEINLKVSDENDEQKNIKHFFNNDANIKVIIEIIDIENDYYLINNEKTDIDYETGITTYKYKYNANNQYFSKLKKVSDMSYILKLLLYLDIYYNQNNAKSKRVSEVINDALKFWSEE